MAGNAGSRREVVVAIHVTLGALHRDVGSGEGERRLGMIEGCRLPRGGGMADVALLRNAGREMVRIRGCLIILQVATDAGSRGQAEISADVTLLALQVGVTAGEGEPDRIMIETRRLPGGGGMAVLASLRESQRNVIGIAGLLIIRQMAADAGCRSAFVPSARMARGAIQGGVHSGESKTGQLQMVEGRAEPGVDGMALLTLHRKIGGNMVRGGGLLICVLVAGVALDGESLELPNRFALMTVGTVQTRVASDKGETISVFLNLLQDDVPAFDRVTLFAVRAHLAAMDIGVAIGAVRSRVRKNGLGMALRARHPFMQAAQGITGLVVIELGDGANRFPPGGGMAVLTRDVQVPMGTAGDSVTSGLAKAGSDTTGQNQAQGNRKKGCGRE